MFECNDPLISTIFRMIQSQNEFLFPLFVVRYVSEHKRRVKVVWKQNI